MDQDLSQPDDLRARREEMRERLRLKADRVLEVVEEMADPKIFIEVERAARAIMATDKMIVQLFSARNAPIVTPSPYRLRRLARHERFTGSFACSSPLRTVVNNGSKGEDEVVEATYSSMTNPKPVIGRLTKRQKRRQRAFHHHAPIERHGVGLGP